MWRATGGLLAALTAVSALAAPAGAEDPAYVPWTELLPGIASPYDPTAADDCTAGRIQCVDKVIREMDRRFQPLRQACDHDAMFSLMYLRTTEEYRRSVADGTFFSDTPFVNHQDVVFAAMYFDAFDAYHRGDLAATPGAWRVAFDAADRGLVTGTGNMLLGMSAHVNRDLPFTLAEIGITKPDGSSRKPDHDKVNEFLTRVVEPLFTEAAATLDPTVDDGNLPFTTLDETATLQLLFSWREQAWRNAERLVLAPTAAERALVAAEIEAFAEAEAEAIVASTAYGPLDGLMGRRAARDAFCNSVN
jgi:hypothetical protein